MIKKPWTEAHEKKYTWLYNYMKKNNENLNYDNFIEANKKTIIGIIKDNQQWNKSSKEALFFMVARYLFNKNNKDKYAKMYSNQGFKLMKEIDKKEQLNEMDNKETASHRDYNYFVDILNNFKEDGTIKTHYEKLLLSLLILQPPLRTNFYITAKKLETIDRDNKKDNYIYIYKRNTINAYYIVNNDKVSETKIYKNNQILKKIKIESEDLSKIIYDSFNKYPRKYLFETADKKPFSEAALLRLLRIATKIENINIDIMRSIYITHFYSNPRTYLEKEELAHKMRHSQLTASKNYNKITKIDKIQQSPLNLSNINKKRYDVLYRYNKGNSKPREITIKKYDIKFNETTNQYY
jgi:hypothetical protein